MGAEFIAPFITARQRTVFSDWLSAGRPFRELRADPQERLAMGPRRAGRLAGARVGACLTGTVVAGADPMARTAPIPERVSWRVDQSPVQQPMAHHNRRNVLQHLSSAQLRDLYIGDLHRKYMGNRTDCRASSPSVHIDYSGGAWCLRRLLRLD